MANNELTEDKTRSRTFSDIKRVVSSKSNISAARRKISESFANSFSFFAKEGSKEKNKADNSSIRTRKISCPISIPTSSERSSFNSRDRSEYSPPNEHPRTRRYSLQQHPHPYMKTESVTPMLPSTISEDTLKTETRSENPFSKTVKDKKFSLQESFPGKEREKSIDMEKSKPSELINQIKKQKASPYESGASSESISPSLHRSPSIRNKLPNNMSKSEKKKSIINMFENIISAEEKSRQKLNHFYEKKKSIGGESSNSSSPRGDAPIQKSATLGVKKTRRMGVYAPSDDIVRKWQQNFDEEKRKRDPIKTDVLNYKDNTIEKNNIEIINDEKNDNLKKSSSISTSEKKDVSVKSPPSESSLIVPKRNSIIITPPRRRRSTITPGQTISENFPLEIIPTAKTNNSYDQSTEKVLTLTKMKLEKLLRNREIEEQPMAAFEHTDALDNESDSNDSGSVSSKAFSQPESPDGKKISVIENPLRKHNLDKLPDSTKGAYKNQLLRDFLNGERLDGDSGIDDDVIKDMNFNRGKLLSLGDVRASDLLSDRSFSVCSSVVADNNDDNYDNYDGDDYNRDNYNGDNYNRENYNGPTEQEDEQFEERSQVVMRRRKKQGYAESIVSLDEIPKVRRISCIDGFQDMTFDLATNEFGSYESNYMGDSVSKRASIYSPLVTFDLTDGTEIVADRETRDIISDSNDTISQCSARSRPASLYFPGTSLNTIRIDEEPADFMMKSKYLNGNAASSTGSSCSNSTINEDEVQPRAQSLSSMINGSEKISVANDVIRNWNRRNNAEVDGSTRKETEIGSETKGNSLEKQPRSEENRSTTFSTMFGYFNYSLYSFISKEYGQEKWKEIVTSLDLNKKQISMFERPKHSMFDDEVTDLVLKTASKILRCNFNLFLQKFGSSYFEFCCSKYGDILKSIATNLADFINNMDDIRRHIHKIEKIADHNPPSIFAVVDRRQTLLLYYYSKTDQRCLEYFLIGFIKSASWVLYGLRSRVSLQQQRKDNNDYSIIAIKAVNSLVKKPSVSKLHVSTKCKDMIVNPNIMDNIFPFHIILNEKLDFCQLGASLNRILEHFIPTHGINLKTYFDVEKPVIDVTYSSIKNNLNTAFIFVCKKEIIEKTSCGRLTLKGQIIFLESSKCLWFIASPKVETVCQLNVENNLYLSDIPIHDATRQVLLVNERTNAQDILKNQLQVLTNRLKETSKELALGKVNTENVLDEIFPKDVAERLMRNLRVPAVTAEEVTILFTDIVGFTSICGSCDPEDVTHMLNNLYLQFDLLCEKYEIYKVETIGDAYMAVGGLHHRKEKDHGRTTTLMGLNMVQASSKVQTPLGENIQIRVGIHSGSVVAGVVGTVMPRYCLFGNNVTLANKMESTSLNGKVHISPTTYMAIKHYEEFIFWERPIEHLPKLMTKLYKGNSYFVAQRRASTYEKPTALLTVKRPPYMMPSRNIVDDVPIKPPSRKTSYSESVISDNTKYPEKLREELKNLEILNGYQNGKSFMLPRIDLY